MDQRKGFSGGGPRLNYKPQFWDALLLTASADAEWHLTALGRCAERLRHAAAEGCKSVEETGERKVRGSSEGLIRPFGSKALFLL